MHNSSPDSERGSALVWALLFVVITSGMIVSHSIFLAAHRKDHTVRYGREALADNFARSGLVEAVSWFRRQPTQPVVDFDPQLDAAADPPVFDTIDQAVGIVREFPIDGNLWGRYEVRHADVEDVSTQLGMTNAGSVWDVGVRAFVYRRNSAEVSFDQEPNRIMLSTAMSTEMRGVGFALPAIAAINLPNVGDLVMSDKAVVDGGGLPALASDVTGGLLGVITSVVTGTPAETKIPGFDASPEAIFSMPMSDLVSYSDIVIEKRIAGRVLEARDSLVAFTGDTVEADGIAIENGLLSVDGDLTLLPGSETKVRGMIYVNGNFVCGGLLFLQGALVVNGSVALNGTTDSMEVRYDPDAMNRLTDMLSRYRLPRSFKPTDG